MCGSWPAEEHNSVNERASFSSMGRGLIQTESRLVIKTALRARGHGAKEFHDLHPVGAGVGALAAADAGRAHVGHARQMIEDRVRGQLEAALALGPAQILPWLVLEDVGVEDALLAVADRTGHAAVVAVDAIRKIFGPSTC